MKKLILSLCTVFLLALCVLVFPTKAQAATIASGAPGDRTELGFDLYWKLDDSGVLTIWGEGTTHYFNEQSSPWLEHRDKVRKVVVQEGVTGIGDCIFSHCTNLTTVELAESVEILGGWVFKGCTNLQSLTIGKNLWKIGWYTFNGCYRLDDADAPGIFYTGTPEGFNNIQTYGGCEWIYCEKTYITRIYQQPKDALVKEGTKASVTVGANGANATYTWYVKKPGGKFVKDACTSNTYSFTMTKALSGTEAYCVVTNSYGYSIQTDTVVMKIKPATITKQPSNVTVKKNTDVKVKVSAAGDGLKYQWYYANKGESKFKKSSVTSATYSLTMTSKVDGRRVYCVVTDKYGNTAKSKVVTLKLTAGAKITTQPKSVAVAVGKMATVSVKATGDGLKYQWYYADKGETKFVKANVTSSKYSVQMDYVVNGRRVYCVVTDKYGYTAKSKVVTLDRPVEITQQPQSAFIRNGKTGKITVEAEGVGLKYTWYYANAGQKKFTRVKSVTGDTLKLEMSSKADGRRFYCKVTDVSGNTVKTETVKVQMYRKLRITQQPKSVKVSSGKYATVTIKATGNGIRYDWFYMDKGSEEMIRLESVTGNTYKVKMSSKNDGRRVFCYVYDQHGNVLESKTATLTIKKAAKITKQPPSTVKAISGTNATVKVETIGDGLKYEWYYANKGATKFKKASSFTGSTCTLKMSASVDGRRVYCKITDKYGNVVKSNVVTLKLAKPTVTAKISIKHTYNQGENFPYEMNVTIDATGGTGKYTYKIEICENKDFEDPYFSDTRDWKTLRMTSSRNNLKSNYMRITVKDSNGYATVYTLRISDGKVLAIALIK